jgi:UDP-glucose 4-epimerase
VTRTSNDSGPVVCVTGGAGFIGSHTVDCLLERGCRVVVLDDFSTGRRANLADHAADPRLVVVEADIADGVFAPLAEVVKRWGPVERMVHLAAQVSVVHSVQNPIADVRVNCIGTVQVLEYARYTGVRKVVFASSAAVYGDTETLPVVEDTPCRPLSPYGIDKLGSENFLAYYRQVHGVPFTAFRFFNVYGPRQDPSSPYSGVISIFADRARAGRPLTIFGDGEQTRDFVYVGDVSRAVADACLGEAADGAVVNLGTGSQITVNQLAATIVELCGGGSEIVHAETRPGEIRHSRAAVDRAHQLLGWKAEVDMREGLRATLA